MSQPGRVDKQSAYILHTQPYRETSLLLEVLTRDHGRFSLVARGARRPRSDLRGVLLPFQPLTLSWFGKGELRTLHGADWDGGVRPLTGLPLVCGFYL
ncbi:DNA repair protein RecO, partial [Pseudomonas sp. MWU12-2534b]